MSQIDENPNKRCRTCLEKTSEHVSLTNKIRVYGEEVILSEIILNCTGLHIDVNDGRPQSICLKCSKDAYSSYQFRATCLKSDMILQNENSTPLFVIEYLGCDPLKEAEISSDSEVEISDDIDSETDNFDKTTSDSDMETTKISSDSNDSIEIASSSKINETNNSICKTNEPKTSKLPEIFPCGLCDKSYCQLRSLHTHLQQDHHRLLILPPEIKVCQCKLCGFICYSIQKCMEHLNSHIDNDVNTSEQATSSQLIPTDTRQLCTTNIQQYYSGMGVDANVLKLVARLDKSESDIKQLADRTETILGTIAFKQLKTDGIKCDMCGEVFTRRYILLKHMDDTHGAHACSTCEAKFMEEKDLLRHQKTHQPREKKFMCDICGRAFADAHNMRAHRRIHTGEKPFECSTCDSKFAQWSSLRSHEKIHTDVRDFVCELCGYATKHKFGLAEHMRRHSEDRNVKCDVCEKKFKTRIQMRSHVIKTHVNKRPFACETCGKGFNGKFALKVHMRSHTGERPFPCTICDKRFTQPCVLRSHMRTHEQH